MHQRLASIVAVIALAGCGVELDDASTGEDEAWEPAEKAAPPAAEPDRADERHPCAPYYIKMKDGFVMKVPVECTVDPLDKGDPPPDKDGYDPAEHPAQSWLWVA